MRLISLTAAIGSAALLATPVGAQQIDHDRVYQALVGQGVASLIRGGAVTPHWLRDGSAFWYTETAGDSTAAWKVDPVAGTRTALVDVGRLRRALTNLLGRDRADAGCPGSTSRWPRPTTPSGCRSTETRWSSISGAIRPAERRCFPVSSETGARRVW